MLRTLTIAAAALLALQGCGFTPLYATADPAGRASLSQIRVTEIVANETVLPLIERAAATRAAREDEAALYGLRIVAREAASPLAVQIDASVTRYNYQLTADYVLTRYSDGKEFRGTEDSIASFNVVDSQYSTLFAEEAAREKAARALMEEIERSILLKMTQDEEREALAAKAK